MTQQQTGTKITVRRLEDGYKIAFIGNIVGNIYFPSVKELEFLIKEFKRVINMIKGAEGI